jgi:hypothetical protein
VTVPGNIVGGGLLIGLGYACSGPMTRGSTKPAAGVTVLQEEAIPAFAQG